MRDLRSVFSSTDLSAGAKLVYLALIGFVSPDGRAYPSMRNLAETIGMSQRQTRRHVLELERRNLIKTTQRFDPEDGNLSNIFEFPARAA